MNHQYILFKKRRQKLGYTFGDAARKSGLAKGTVISAEKKGSDPLSSTLKKLSICYGLDPSLSMKLNMTRDELHLAINGAG